MSFRSIWFVIAFAGLLHTATYAGQPHWYRQSGLSGSSGSSKQNIGPVSGSVSTSSDVCTPSAPTKNTFPTSNEGCFPNTLENGVPNDPFQNLGVFYEFRSRSQPVQVYNTRYINSLVCDGSIYLPGTNVPAVQLTLDVRYITLSRMNEGNGYPPVPGYRYNYGLKVNCTYNWIDILSRYNGIDNAYAFYLSKGEPGQSVDVYNYLYEKPGDRGFAIQYACGEPNHQTFICDKVTVYVFSRLKPSQMTPEEIDEIESTTDRVLAPYCMSKNDLQKVIHRADLDLDQCDMPPPEAFTNLVNGYAGSLPKRKPSDQRFHAPQY